MHTPVRRHKIVVESGHYPGLLICPAPFGVDVRRPGHRQRVHAIFVLKNMGRIEGILAAGPRHEAVVLPITAPMLVAQLQQFLFPVLPIYRVPLPLGHSTGIAYAFFIEVNRGLLRLPSMFELYRRVRALIRNHATLAELNLRRQPVVRLRCVVAWIVCFEIEMIVVWEPVHYDKLPPALFNRSVP